MLISTFVFFEGEVDVDVDVDADVSGRLLLEEASTTITNAKVIIRRTKIKSIILVLILNLIFILIVVDTRADVGRRS